MKSMALPETATSKNAVMFLQHFIMQSRSYPSVTSAVLKKGEEIIHTTLLCIGVYTLRTHVDVFADIFVAFNKKYPAELIAWLKILEVTDFPTTFVTPQDKEQFMKAVIRYDSIIPVYSLCLLNLQKMQTFNIYAFMCIFLFYFVFICFLQ